MVFPCLSGFHGCLLDALVALEERAEAIFHAHTHIPHIEVLVDRRHLEEDGAVKVFGGDESHFGQYVAFGNFLFLLGHAYRVRALFQKRRAECARLLPVSLSILAVHLAYKV